MKFTITSITHTVTEALRPQRKIRSLFAVRPTHWWQRFSPTWRTSSAALQAWLDANQIKILIEFQSEQLQRHISADIEKAILNDFYGRGPVDPFSRKPI